MIAVYWLICQEASKRGHYTFDYVTLKTLKASLFPVFWCSGSNYILKMKNELCWKLFHSLSLKLILNSCAVFGKLPEFNQECLFQEFCPGLMGDRPRFCWGWRLVWVHSTEQGRPGTCLSPADCERYVPHRCSAPICTCICNYSVALI